MGLLDEFKLSDDAKHRLHDKVAVTQALRDGRTLHEIVGFSSSTMAKFYRAAYRLLVQRRYADAEDAFLFLTALNPLVHDYWLGFGMAAQLNRDFEVAIDAYELAAVREIDNPVPYLYLAKCLFALHERECALAALDLAIEYAGEREAYRELKDSATAARHLLIREQKENEIESDDGSR